MEAIVRPFLSWDEWPDATREFFKAQRTPAGEELILEKNLFIEYLLPLRGHLARRQWRSIAATTETLGLRANRC